MAVSEWSAEPATKPNALGFLNDARVRGVLFQILVIVALTAFVWWIVDNTITNLQARNIASGFGFLDNTAGFGIVDTPGTALLNYSETSTYGTAILVGIVNTLVVAIIGIILATILGFIIGIARLSSNWIVSQLAYAYIEIMRNIPLLLQILIWYKGVLGLLSRDAVELGPFGFLNARGYYAPEPIFGEGAGLVLVAFAAAVAAIVLLRSWARRRQLATGRQFPILWTSLALLVGLPLITWIVVGASVEFAYPEAGRFNIRGGVRIIPEMLALTLALVIYTAAFIAEVVRAGILAVSGGQTEAAYSLGLRPGTTLRLVVVPQALRVIIPPLTSQYLNLTKNSSLAVAIAFPDLVSSGGIVLNQSGQAIEIVAIWMVVYLTISLLTAAFMNWYNRRVALVER